MLHRLWGPQLPNYTDIFNARGGDYVDAHAQAPGARDAEAAHLIDRLDLSRARRICDMPAGGGFVAERVRRVATAHNQSLDIVCVEPSAAFAKRIDAAFETIRREPADTGLPSARFDRIASLAGLHHYKDKNPFFREAARLLAPDGALVVADVACGSAPAAFLNEAVDQHTETGHEGWFFAAGEFSRLLEAAGFNQIEERLESFHWAFSDEATMVAFCRSLFGMTSAPLATVAREIERYLAPVALREGVGLPWSLIYARGVKA